MKRYNVILLADAAGENILMCRRMKPPYQGLYNLVGGKIEAGEDGLHSAYRELREETGVSPADVTLRHLMTFCYPGVGEGAQAVELQAYAGRLRREVQLKEEANPLLWMPVTEDFFDLNRFSGEGNIGHMVETTWRNYPELLEGRPQTISLSPLSEDDLPVLAYDRKCPVEALRPMLAESAARSHQGRYYEQFAIRVDGCAVGTASLYEHEDGTVSDGVEVFPTFRRCGYAARTLALLTERARERGYAVMTAQVRTDNAASIALHRRAGFQNVRTFLNRKGHEVHEMRKLIAAPVRHEMSLRPKPFGMIASGEKTCELRLHDEKCRSIRIGDEIVFTRTTDGVQLTVRVTGLQPFPDFAALYASLPLLRCGYTKENIAMADPKDMEAYYPPEKQAQYGVLGIEIERIRYPLEALSGAYAVRELTAEDVPDMLRLAQSNPLYYEHMRTAPTAENLSETLTALPPNRTMADKHFFGWFQNGRLIALMDLIARHPSPEKAFIGWFMVDGAAQGRGLGRRLIADVLAMLSAEGVQEVRLGRIAGNPQSERFWHACGFQENGLGYDTADYHVAVMERKLP